MLLSLRKDCLTSLFKKARVFKEVGLSQGQTQVFFLFYTAEAQFVPETNPVCPRDIPGTKGGRQSLCVKSLCAFFVPYPCCC